MACINTYGHIRPVSELSLGIHFILSHSPSIEDAPFFQPVVVRTLQLP